MPNKNYIKGRRKEYKICHSYKSMGYEIAQRTAGSHSPIDVIAINLKKKKIKFIQAKPDSWTIKQVKSLEEENKKLNGLFKCEFIVV